jgi:hypothetical protein
MNETIVEQKIVKDMVYRMVAARLASSMFAADKSKNRSWDVSLHKHDDHNGKEYHKTEKPMVGKLSPAEAKAYWDQLKQEGRDKYGSLNALVDPKYKNQDQEVEEDDDEVSSHQSQPAKPGTNPLPPIGNEPKKLRDLDENEMGHKLYLLTPDENMGKNGTIQSGSNKARKLDDPTTGESYCVKDYSRADPLHGENHARAEAFANRIMTDVFGLVAPDSTVVESIDVPGTANGNGYSVISTWVSNDGDMSEERTLDDYPSNEPLPPDAFEEVAFGYGLKEGVLDDPGHKKDLARIFAASMLSGDYDTVGPMAANVVIHRDTNGKSRLAPIDNAGYVMAPTFGVLDRKRDVEGVDQSVPLWSGRAPKSDPSGRNIPQMGLSRWRDKGFSYGYPHNFFTKVMNVVSDDDLSEALDCLDKLDDETIDKYVAQADFKPMKMSDPSGEWDHATGNIKRITMNTSELVAKNMKNRRDILKEVNKRYKDKKAKGEKADFPDVHPDTYHSMITSSVEDGQLRKILTSMDPIIIWKIMDLFHKGYDVGNIGYAVKTASDVLTYGGQHEDLVRQQINSLKDSDIERIISFMGSDMAC